MRYRNAKVPAAARDLLTASLPLGLALGLALPAVALTFPASTSLALDPTPDGRWAGGWKVTARTVSELESTAFGDALLLLVGLALVSWLAALVGGVLAGLRRLAVEEEQWVLRSTVGGTRNQLRREALFLGLRTSVLAGLCGWLLAAVVLEFLLVRLPAGVRAATDAAPALLSSLPVVAVLAVTGVAITVPPLLMLPRASALRRPARAHASVARRDVTRLLAATQVAASLALVICAVLLSGGAREVGVTTGYPNARDTLILRVQLPEANPSIRSWEAIGTGVRGVAGIEAASIASPGAALGLGTVDRGGAECPTCVSGGIAMPVSFGRARHLAADSAFFTLLGVEAPPPRRNGVVIDTLLRHEWFQGGEAIDRGAWVRGATPLRGERRRVAGVVALPSPTGLGAGDEPIGAVYLSLEEALPREADLLVRSRVFARGLEDPEAGAFTAAVRAAVEDAVRGSRVELLGRHDELLSERVEPVRWLGRVISGLAAASLLLALLSLHGAMAERVRMRRAEIGLRRTVGATRGAIVRLLLADAARLAGGGALAGAVVGASLNRGLPALAGEVEPLGLETFAGLVVLTVAAGLLSAAAGSIRASRLDPVELLRG